MALEEKTEVELTVTDSNYVLLRTATVVAKDGVELSRSYHRESFAPGDDVSGQPEKVRAFCALAWA